MKSRRSVQSVSTLTPRLMRALVASGGAGVLAGSAPAWLLESLTMASGLAAIFPPAAPPLGFTARILFAIAAASIALVLVWTLWRSANDQADARSTARGRSGGAAPTSAPQPASIAEPVSGRLLGGLKAMLGGRAYDDDDEEDRAQLAARRRADRHPDAPPRPPLVASRDLPDVDAMPIRKRALVSDVPAGVDTAEPAAVPTANLAGPSLFTNYDPPAVNNGPPATDVASSLSFSPMAPELSPPTFEVIDPFMAEPVATFEDAPAINQPPEPVAFQPFAIDDAQVAETAVKPLDTDDDAFTFARSLGGTQNISVPNDAVNSFDPSTDVREMHWANDEAAFGSADPTIETFAPAQSVPPCAVEEPVWFDPADTVPSQSPVQFAPIAVPAAPEIALAEPAAAAKFQSLPPLPADDLATLAARFETGIARREAIFYADAAARTLEARIALADQDLAVREALRAVCPMTVVPDLAPPPPMGQRIASLLAQESDAQNLDQDVDMALEQALGTLRKLSELGRR